MKAVFPMLLLAVAAACRTASPADRNTLPNNRPITEATMFETAEPSRKAGLALPDSAAPARPLPADSLRPPRR